MSLMDKLSRRLRRLAIPNLMIYITGGMLGVFLLDMALPYGVSSYLSFHWASILRGEVWRLLTFAFLPPGNSILFIILTLYFYYFIGSSLENAWGSTRFTIYYLFGMLGTIIAGVLTGGATNYYLNLSLFFAFAQLWPDHQLLLFFILPVKIKWIAWLNWAYFLFSFIQGNAVARAAILFSLLNFFLFFGPDFFSGARQRLHAWKRRQEFRRNMKNNPWR